MTIKNQLINLIKAHIKLGRVSWVKLSEVDQNRISDGCELIRSAVLGLAGMPDACIGDVMKKFNITDNDVVV